MLEPVAMGDQPHLLLVDDERSIREPLAVYLTKQGFRVTQAGDAESARARLAAYAIDLAIIDIMMPGEDGLSLCRHIAATSEVPVILLTAKATDENEALWCGLGVLGVIAKPFAPTTLVEQIDHLLATHLGDVSTPLSA